ncbi:hypothetical protein MSG28_008982, partial [Choristoneura fumiferana]
TEYKKLPALYELDEFYPCLQTSGDLYCYVDALLVSNTTSELLNEYSAQTITHFNHTVVHRGVCMTQTCRQYLGNSTNLDQALEECLNATLYETHQLQVNLIKDKVECTYYNEKVEIDAGDCAVATIMARKNTHLFLVEEKLAEADAAERRGPGAADAATQVLQRHQTFFIISGFLLAYNILLVEEKTKVDWKMLPKGLVLRWLSRSLVWR